MLTNVMRLSRLLAPAAVAAMALTGCGSAGTSGNTLSMNSASCGGTWSLSGPGWHTFELYNANDVGAEVDLINPATNGVYAELDDFGPGTTTPMSLDVGSGKYAFRCLFDDATPLTGPTVSVAGHAKGASAIVPITFNDLVGPDNAYHAYVESGLKVLSGETATLASDFQHGDLTAARRDWLTAHLQYETLGAAYDAFGSFDDEIDGRADALGVTNPKWTGFYRLEYGLWHGQPAAELKPYATGLASNVKALLASWPSTQIPLIDLALRIHEILENALEFQLSGHDDYGSGTTLATVQANITGTRELLSLLHPLLVTRYTGLPLVYTWLDRLQTLVDAEHLSNGSWVPESSLSQSQQQDLDAAGSQVLQELSPIPTIAEPRNT
jgi:iron uptake system EfeUOB component EfeO/EfeM